MAKGRVTYGDKGFELTIEKFEKQYIAEVKRVIAETAEMIVSIAKANAPTDTSNLKKSIQADYFDDGLTAIVHVDASYGIYVNYGTGIYASGPGGSSAKKIPWVYYSEELGRWVMTRGMRATHFFDKAMTSGSMHFASAMNKLG
jgi:HK97 gp10 family phage protein